MFQEGKILARYEEGNQIIELQERNLEKAWHREPRAAACRRFPAREQVGGLCEHSIDSLHGPVPSWDGPTAQGWAQTLVLAAPGRKADENRLA